MMSLDRMQEIALACSMAMIAGCGISLPDGVTCNHTLSGGTSGEDLSDALADAESGDCVSIASHKYEGAFLVPAGVKLVAEKDTVPDIVGTDESQPAIRVLGGTGSGLVGVRVTKAAAIGIAVQDAPVALTNVSVSGAGVLGVAVVCSQPDCTTSTESVTVEGSSISGNNIGLWVQGARVAMKAGAVSNNYTTQVVGGQGIIAARGAHLSLDGTSVEGNAWGILLDGTGGSTADCNNVKVTNNAERGIWSQHLRGTLDNPALTVRGEDTVVDGNGAAGIGAADSAGIIIVDGRVANTVAIPWMTDLGVEPVGDGIGLFGQSGAVRIQRVTLENNQRCQALVDDGAAGIIIVDGYVAASADQYRVVVQNTESGNVSVTPEVVSTPSAPLGIIAQVVEVPDIDP